MNLDARHGAFTGLGLLAAAVFFCVMCLPACRDRASSEDGPSAGSSEEPSAVPSSIDQGGTKALDAGPGTHADAIVQPGLYNVDGGQALALETGLSWDDTAALLDEAVAAGSLTVSGTTSQRKELGGVALEVRVRRLQLLRGGDTKTIRLTFFGDDLVGIVLTYHAPDPDRVLGFARRLGPGVHGSGWVGWWLRDEAQIIQASPDGSSYEVFDLGAARRTVPDVDTHMLASWRRRYKVPPPWGRELVETP